MNSAVITKIEYRIFPEENFTELDIIPHQGSLNELSTKDESGNKYFACQVNLKMAKVEPVKDAILKSIDQRKGQYRITDANDIVFLVGDESYPARLSFERKLDGTPGSFNGYRCVITCDSPDGSIVELAV